MTNNSKRTLQEQNKEYQNLLNAMFSFFQVIPQSSSSFKSYTRKLRVFEKHYKWIKQQSGDSVE